jgi:hypothetical protein
VLFFPVRIIRPDKVLLQQNDKGTPVSNKEIHINQGLKKGCPVSPTLFHIFIDEIIRQWQDVLIKDFKIGNTVEKTILFLFLFNQRTAFKEQLIDFKI